MKLNLRAGDVVSLGVHPTIPMGDYQSLKPSAHLTRTVELLRDQVGQQGMDANEERAFVEGMRVAVRGLFYVSLLTEVEAFVEAMDATRGCGDTEELTKKIIQEIGDVCAQSKTTVARHGGVTKAPRVIGRPG